MPMRLKRLTENAGADTILPGRRRFLMRSAGAVGGLALTGCGGGGNAVGAAPVNAAQGTQSGSTSVTSPPTAGSGASTPATGSSGAAASTQGMSPVAAVPAQATQTPPQAAATTNPAPPQVTQPAPDPAAAQPAQLTQPAQPTQTTQPAQPAQPTQPAPSTQPSPQAATWIPPAGYFADVPMLNNPADINPSLYGSGATDGAFIIWGGSAILRDYGPLGAQVYYSGGHESSAGEPNIQLSLVCDFSTLTWAVRNLPASPNPAGGFNLQTGLAADGTPYCPHTYLGLQEFPAAWGGAASGSLASFFWAGSSFINRVNKLDVSQTRNGYSQLPTTQAQNADPSRISFRANGGNSGGTYPITVQDIGRQGWWLATNGEVDYTLFLSRTGAITQYTAVNGNGQDGCLVLCDSLNLLIFVDGGYDSGIYMSNSYRTLNIRNLANNTSTTSQVSGQIPGGSIGYAGGTIPNYHTPGKMGLQWVEDLQAIVGLDETTSPPTVMKLTPPASNPAQNPWTWSAVPLQHWPADTNGQTILQRSQNSVWSKFRYVPALKAFVYCTAANRKPQVITL